MKLRTVLLALTICLLALSGCAGRATGDPITDAEAPDWGLTLTAQDVTPTGMTLAWTLEDMSIARDLMTGAAYELQVNRSGMWYRVGYKPSLIDRAWPSVGLRFFAGSGSWEINWENLYGKLPRGTYRIVKEIMMRRGTGGYDASLLYAGFVIG